MIGLRYALAIAAEIECGRILVLVLVNAQELDGCF